MTDVAGSFDRGAWTGSGEAPASDDDQANGGDANQSAGVPVSTVEHAWRFLILCEMANFPVLRRRIGRDSVDALLLAITERVGQALPTARLRAQGPITLEITLTGYERRDLDASIACLEAAFRSPIGLGDDVLDIEMLVGGASAPAAAVDLLTLDEGAEAALADARVAHCPIMRNLPVPAARLNNSGLAADVLRAIDAGEFFVNYQPKVHVRRQEIASAEALIRWSHPDRGLILPNDFIPAAEQGGSIAALTLWTLRKVIDDQHELARRGHDIELFVNISGQLLANDAFIGRACELISGSGARIGLEITETSVIQDPQSAIGNLRKFADLGIKIAIDDYGSGLSSLAYLKQMPASELKIDKLFITQLSSSNRDPLIVRSTIDLAHALDMEVTAEGVESQASLALLSVMGCDMVQGFLISRPIAFEPLCEFLAEERHRSAASDPRAAFNLMAGAWKRA